MLRKWVFIVILSFLFVQITSANNFVSIKLDWYNFKYIKYDTKSKDYIFKIGVNPDYTATSLRDLMELSNWISAINGVFFCPASYRECGGRNFTHNERYYKWNKIWMSVSTQDRVVFAVDKNGSPFLYQTDKINPNDEDKIYYWFANFPLLLQDWVSKYNDYVDLWLIDKKMTAKMQRNFICSDKTNRYIYTWYISAISLEKLPEVLIKLGCNNALNLDAGWSGAMIYNSRYILWPGRDVLDWVVIERKNLDTKKIIEKSKKVKLFIEDRLTNKSITEKVDYLNTLTTGLTKIRGNVYEKNSIDLFDEESWEIVWYEINVKKIKDVEKVYFLNYLNKLFAELKEYYINEDIEKIETEKERINKENWLF